MSQAAIDAREAQVRWTIENSFKTVSADRIWRIVEVNEFGDYGQTNKTVARTQFRSDRQVSKPVVVGADQNAAFSVDVLQNQHQELMSEMFHAAFREKPTTEAVTISTEIESVTVNEYLKTAGSWATEGYAVGSLVWATGFDRDTPGTYADNDGLKTVNTVSATDLTVDETLTAQLAAAIPLSAAGIRGAHIVNVGFEFVAGDLACTGGGGSAFTTLTLSAGVWADTGLQAGEWFLIGDGTLNFDTNPENNGWKQVDQIDATDKILTIRKSQENMITETPAGAVRIFFGRVLKNEVVSSLITRNTMQFERALGPPDIALPDQLQADYLTGATAASWQFNKNAEDKITADLVFLPSGYETFSPTGAPPQLKSELAAASTGGAPPVVSEDSYNTDVHYSYLEVHLVSSVDETPVPLFQDIETMTLSIDNEANANKALKNRGSCGTSLGSFRCTGTMSGYLEDMAPIDAVDANSDVTIGLVMVQGPTGAKFGWSLDFPLLGLGNGLPELELGQKIKLPLDLGMASGDKLGSHLNFSAMMSYFDYLPDSGDVTF